MTSYAIGGQGSGDFKETSARVQIFHVVTRNSIGLLTPDAFTQSNPPKVTTQVSTTLASIAKVGVLGGSVAFTRPDYGNNSIGGPNTASYAAGCRPLGVFINDAIGNAYENTPGVASGRGPYLCGSGTCVGLAIYETKVQLGGGAGGAVTYNPGDAVWASVNGLITNVLADAYETLAADTAPGATLMGIVKVAPDANSSLLVIDLRV